MRATSESGAPCIVLIRFPADVDVSGQVRLAIGCEYATAYPTPLHVQA